MAATADRPLVFCLAHAGGSAAAWADWRTELEPLIDVVPLELAGRGKRMREEFSYGSLHEVADELIEHVGQIAGDRSYTLVGHSMGGLVAYEMALRSRSSGESPLGALVVMGTPPPDRDRPKLHAARRSDEALLDALSPLGGIPDEIAEDAAVRRLFVPILRQDYVLFESYEKSARTRALSCPVLVLTASADPVNQLNDELLWRRAAPYAFASRVVPGAGHFFPHTHRREALGAVSGFVQRVHRSRAGGTPGTGA